MPPELGIYITKTAKRFERRAFDHIKLRPKSLLLLCWGPGIRMHAIKNPPERVL